MDISNGIVAKLQLVEEVDAEICHFYEPASNTFIYSRGNSFFGEVRGNKFKFKIPVAPWFAFLLPFRLSRRVLRLDKSNCHINYRGDGLIIIYLGKVYFYALDTKTLKSVCRLEQCRNIPHLALCVTKSAILFGEYGSNSRRLPVPIWSSPDDGRSWAVANRVEGIRHVHGIYKDPFREVIWITTGDLDGECRLLEASPLTLKESQSYGDGTQVWRAVSLLFRQDAIYWGMDSETQTSYFIRCDRASMTPQFVGQASGPVWYSKRLTDDSFLFQTTVEVGVGVKERESYLFLQTEGDDCMRVAGSFHKDPLPMRFFKFGVIAFAEGGQSRDDFVIFGEGLFGIDGKVLRCRLV